MTEEKPEVAPVQPKNAPRKESKVIVAKPEKTGTEIGKTGTKLVESVPEEIKLHDVNPQIPEPDPKPEEARQEEKTDVQQDTAEQIPGQDEIMNHPELLPEVTRGTEKLIADIKMEAAVIKTSIAGWEYYIPKPLLENLLGRVEHLRELLIKMKELHNVEKVEEKDTDESVGDVDEDSQTMEI